jgi:hypothetical protein
MWLQQRLNVPTFIKTREYVCEVLCEVDGGIAIIDVPAAERLEQASSLATIWFKLLSCEPNIVTVVVTKSTAVNT